MSAAGIAAASDAMTAEVLAIWEAGAGERRRRRLLELIDRALDECEERNLAAGAALDVPAWVQELVELLLRETGEVRSRPRHTVAAHGLLLDLQEHYLPEPPVSSEEDSAWAMGDAVWQRGRREGRW